MHPSTIWFCLKLGYTRQNGNAERKTDDTDNLLQGFPMTFRQTQILCCWVYPTNILQYIYISKSITIHRNPSLSVHIHQLPYGSIPSYHNPKCSISRKTATFQATPVAVPLEDPLNLTLSDARRALGEHLQGRPYTLML